MGGVIPEISRRSVLKGGSILSFTKANLLHGKRFCFSAETSNNLKTKYVDLKTKEAFYTAVSTFYECLVKKEEIGERKFIQAYQAAQGILVAYEEKDIQMTKIFEEMERDLWETRMFDECFEA